MAQTLEHQESAPRRRETEERPTLPALKKAVGRLFRRSKSGILEVDLLEARELSIRRLEAGLRDESAIGHSALKLAESATAGPEGQRNLARRIFMRNADRIAGGLGSESAETVRMCGQALDVVRDSDPDRFERGLAKAVGRNTSSLIGSLRRGNPETAEVCLKQLNRAGEVLWHTWLWHPPSARELIRNMDVIDSIIKARDPRLLAPALDLASGLNDMGGEPGECNQRMQVFMRNLDVIRDGLESDSVELHHACTRALKGIYYWGNEREEAVAVGTLEAHARKMITESGLKPDYALWAWKTSHWNACETPLYGTMTANVNALKELRTARPDAPSALFKKFGILCYGRYRPEMLARQYDQMDDAERPYGLIIAPYDDHNGSDYCSSTRIFAGVSDSLESHGVHTRIMEFDDRWYFAKTMLGAEKRYGKAVFGVLGGHGNREVVELWVEENHGFSVGEVQRGAGVKLWERCFADKAPLILLSCEGGVEGGVGQAMSERYDTEVIGAERISGLKSIVVEKMAEGRPVFGVEYYKGRARRYVSGQPA